MKIDEEDLRSVLLDYISMLTSVSGMYDYHTDHMLAKARLILSAIESADTNLQGASQ